MSIPAPESLLFQALILPRAQAKAAWSTWRSSVDLDVLDSGSFHLLPALAALLNEWTLNDPQQAILKGICRRAWTQNQLARKRFVEALAVLSDAGIKRVAATGPLLWAEKYWPAGAVRPIGRVDLLVEPDSARAAFGALGKNGFSADAAGRSSIEAIDWRFKRGVLLRSAAGDVWLHWRAIPNTHFSLRRPDFPSFDSAPSGHLSPFILPVEYSLVAAVSGVCQDSVDWRFDALMICRQPGLSWDKVGQLMKRRPVERARLDELRRMFAPNIPPAVTKSDWTDALGRPLVSALQMYRSSRLR